MEEDEDEEDMTLCTFQSYGAVSAASLLGAVAVGQRKLAVGGRCART